MPEVAFCDSQVVVQFAVFVVNAIHRDTQKQGAKSRQFEH